MVTVKILQRHDASAIIVAIVMATIGIGLVSGLTMPIADFFSGNSISGEYDLNRSAVYPLILAILQLIALEIGLRIAVFACAAYLKR